MHTLASCIRWKTCFFNARVRSMRAWERAHLLHACASSSHAWGRACLLHARVYYVHVWQNAHMLARSRVRTQSSVPSHCAPYTLGACCLPLAGGPPHTEERNLSPANAQPAHPCTGRGTRPPGHARAPAAASRSAAPPSPSCCSTRRQSTTAARVQRRTQGRAG